jgi:alanine dehydrogenase
MDLGLLKETTAGEARVALTPASVRRLVERGHRVLVEHGAGDGSHYPDAEYAAAGAKIIYSGAEVMGRASLVMKVGRPTAVELEQLTEEQAVMAFFHLVTAERRDIHRILAKRITAIGYEIIETADRRLPVLEPVSEIAGQMSIAVASHLLRSTSGGRGILLGGSAGFPPARVVILGAGVVGTAAARAAVDSGARTLVFDTDVAKLRRLLGEVRGVSTAMSDAPQIAEAIRAADVLIGAVLLHGERAPHLVTRGMVESMQQGSVIIDVSIDQGGCVETSRPTSLFEPVYSHGGVLHYAVPNMTADIARTASAALSYASLPYVLEIAASGLEEAIARRAELARGVYTYRGKATSRPLAARWDLTWSDIQTLIGKQRGAR